MKVEVDGKELEIDESLIEEDQDEIRRQVEEYLAGERTSFSLSFSLPDTVQGDILRAMEKIPYGETRTYSQLADEACSAAIAVGQACASNPLPLIVPCHRVVGKDSIGGYQAGEEVKRILLELEGADF